MKKIIITFIGLIFISFQSLANPENFDIYGVDEQTKQKIFSCCSDMIEKYMNLSSKLNLMASEPGKDERAKRLKLEEQIISRVKKIDHFAEAKLSVVFYPTDRNSFGTLDLVKINEKERLPRKVNLVKNRNIVQSKHLKKLFKVWKDYEAHKIQLIRENKLDFSKLSCPTIHCTWGFDESDIHSVLPKLQKGVKNHKQALFDLIKYSSDNKARGEAIFIVANNNDDQELANFLIDFVDDPSGLVRNNSMRVLGAIAAKNKVNNIKIDKIIKALNYPFLTDRNKAAYILFGIVKSHPKTHALVINNAGTTLIELLKLKQPNNHDYAYQILRVISHKNYDEYDYNSWNKWIKEKH